MGNEEGEETGFNNTEPKSMQMITTAHGGYRIARSSPHSLALILLSPIPMTNCYFISEYFPCLTH